MKRILFYLLIAVQVIAILFLTFQFEQIDEQGKMIQLRTNKPEYPIYDFIYERHMYVEYEINRIPEDKVSNANELDFDDRVYVLLKSGSDGVYQVERVSNKKLTSNQADEIVLVGQYHYHDEQRNYHFVNYGMEEIKHVNEYGEFRGNDQLLIT